MNIKVLPESKLGHWSAWLNILFLVVSIFLYLLAEKYKVIESDTVITVIGSSAILASLIAFITGIFAITREKEKSILTYFAILMGLAVIAFIFGDILFP